MVTIAGGHNHNGHGDDRGDVDGQGGYVNSNVAAICHAAGLAAWPVFFTSPL